MADKDNPPNIGLGATALAASLSGGHADGISVYTQALRTHMPPEVTLRPVVFGQARAQALAGSVALPGPYSAQAAAAFVSGLPFVGAGALAQRIDLFHATDHYIPKLRRTPVVATIHDVIGIRHPEWTSPRLRSLKNSVFRQAAQWAHTIITISQYSAQDLTDWLGAKAPRIVTIPQGVGAEYFARIAPEQRQQQLQHLGLDERPYFLMVGTLQPRKNIERVLAAHASLPADMQKAYPLVIVGQNGWRTQELLPQLAQLQDLGRGVWLRGLDKDTLLAVFQGAQALVFPSLYEGFGLPVLEGFASQIPVICSDTTSLPEVAADAAILVDPLRVEAIAHAMQSTIENPEQRADWIARGLEQARRFSWQQTAEKTARVYQEVLEKSAR